MAIYPGSMTALVIGDTSQNPLNTTEIDGARWPVGIRPGHQRIGKRLRWLRRPAAWIRSIVHAQTQ
jgi:hypothetical protein